MSIRDKKAARGPRTFTRGKRAYDKKSGILIKKYNCIYIVNPKAGTSSIKAFIMKDLLGIQNDDLNNGHKFDFDVISNLDIYRDKKYYKFTFVRNPWDRLVSCYNDKITRYYMQKKEAGIFRGFEDYNNMHPGMSFEDFVSAVCNIPDDASNKHFKSQYSICYYNDKPLYDFVGKIENISSDFKNLSNLMKFPSSVLPHRLRTSEQYKLGKLHYTEFYNDKTTKRVSKRYSKDISLFKYSFGS